MFDPASGDLFVLDGDLDRLVEVDPVTGNVAATFVLPFAVDKNAGGLAIDPATGHLWVGSSASSDVAELDPATGTVIRLLSLASQGIGAEISGLSFDAAGDLLVSSTLGVVYRLTTFVPVLPAPSLTAIDAVAPAGVPTDAAVASANAGQVITIVGTGFRRGDLQVLFPTRDEAGVDDCGDRAAVGRQRRRDRRPGPRSPARGDGPGARRVRRQHFRRFEPGPAPDRADDRVRSYRGGPLLCDHRPAGDEFRLLLPGLRLHVGRQHDSGRRHRDVRPCRAGGCGRY